MVVAEHHSDKSSLREEKKPNEANKIKLKVLTQMKKILARHKESRLMWLKKRKSSNY